LQAFLASGSRITSLDSAFFNSTQNLSILDLSFSNISAFPAFEGLISSSIATLDLSNKELTVIGQSVSLYEDLRVFKCGYNRITSIMSRDFERNIGLIKIDLGYNSITYVAVDAFNMTWSLRELSIHGNAITELPLGVFDSLAFLSELSLARNRISYLPPYIFARNSKIYTLFVHFSVCESC
jgi:Leucine-rich repeat (LRR) protein